MKMNKQLSINLYHGQVSLIYIIFIIIELQISKSASYTLYDKSVCQTPLCKELAKTFINNMNPQVDPCDNFFRYTCGNFAKDRNHNNDVDHDISSNLFSLLSNRTDHRLKEIMELPISHNDNIALKKSKQLYKACMDTNRINKIGLRSLSRALDKFGGWPMTMTYIRWKLYEKPWQEIDAMIRKSIGLTPFFIMAVMADMKNSSSNIQWLTPPIPSGETESFKNAFAHNYTGNSFTDAYVEGKRYQEAIVNSAKLIINHKGLSILNKQLDVDARAIILFELELQNVIASADVDNTSDINDGYEKMTIDELQNKFDQNITSTSNGKIYWYNYIRRVYSDVTNVYIRNSDEIAFVSENYFIKLMALLDRTPSRTIVNTIHWWLIKKLSKYVNSKMNSIVNYKVIDTTPRWKFCITHNGMEHAISQAYVEKYFSRESKRYVTNMVKEITSGMKDNIDRSKWLDHYSKSGALKKLGLMKEFVGFPDWYDDKKSVSSYYHNLRVGKNFFDNTLALAKLDALQELKLLRRPVDKNGWITTPTAINAFYYYPGNSLTLPAGILQYPFFNDKQPSAINFGAIGSFIAHEISHGFDDIGSQYDENGNVRNWWSNHTKNEYNKKAECFINQFDKFEIIDNNISHRLDPVHTLSENIADTTGINAVIKAFTIHLMNHPEDADVKLPGLEHLSSKQLLFLSWAHSFCARPKLSDLLKTIESDNHSPAEFRIIGTLSNIDSFSETYQCNKGTNMNPIDKCSIW